MVFQNVLTLKQNITPKMELQSYCTDQTPMSTEVISILWENKCVSTSELLSCRLACRRWRSVVDASGLIPTPTSHWTITFDLTSKESTWTGDLSSAGATALETCGPFQHTSRILDAWNSLHFVKPMLPKINLMHGDPEFPSILKSMHFDPCRTQSLDYAAVIDADCLITWNQSNHYYVTIGYKNGRRSWSITCDSEQHAASLVKYLSSLFHRFPGLQSLHLRLSISPSPFPPYMQKGLDELEGRILSSLEALEVVRLNSLRELHLECQEDKVALPTTLSALIACSPRLQKVRLSLVTINNANSEDDDHHHITDRQGLADVLKAIFNSPSVKTLELMGWKEELRLDQLLPRKKSWHLRSLSVTLAERDQIKNTASRALQTFFDILNLLSESPLQELRIEARATRCGAFGSKMGRRFGRVCKCNMAYSESLDILQAPQFQPIFQYGKAGTCCFRKLRVLDFPHGLIHPALFPGVMKPCQNLRELRICCDERNACYWTSNNNIVILRDLRECAFQLFAKSPPSLHLILFRDSSGSKWSHRFSRVNFEKNLTSKKRKSLICAAFVGLAAVATVILLFFFYLIVFYYWV